MRYIGPVIGLFIFGYFAWFMFLGASIGIENYIKGGQSEGWPKTEGVITYSDVEQTGHGKRSSWDAVIRYDYALDARGGFRGTRVRFGWEGDSTDASQRAVAARFPKGQRVAVVYNPDKPEEAVLLAGRGEQSWAGMWVAIVLGLMCGFGALVWVWTFYRLVRG